MTPTNRTDDVRQVADEIVDNFSNRILEGESAKLMVNAIASAITSAVEAEREMIIERLDSIEHFYQLDSFTDWLRKRSIRQTPTKEGV